MVNTEQLIIEAATNEFAIKGFDGARTSAIAARAGVTHAMLHYYFRTKEQLFERIAADIFDRLFEMMVTALTQPGMNLRERIAAGVAAHFDFISAHREVPMFALNVLNTRPELMQSFSGNLSQMAGSVLTRIQQEFDDAAAQGIVKPIDAKMLLIDMVSLNLFPFIARHMLNAIIGITDYEAFLQAKRQENITTIINRIMP